ncbi:hypothetical protein KM427_15735 [Nocardioides sp. LMS-CY]|uniref:hypothetical protein n=1 Tax=Nocardioides sp. (strain LMS-CY) TaxID=2840457 RepID=UPI001C0041E7|nr:hypothetical protein [Nocardioides sp. LMS-CY]QWF20432.1 hypothetical protein KM427_15735 [Nocardioides sp. LMS-CY]
MSVTDQPAPPAPAGARHSRGLTRRRKIVVAGVGVAAAAALVAGGIAVTGAYFTSQATVGGQSVGTATVAITAGTAASSAPISAASLLPGDSESTTIDLANTGSEDVYYTIRLPKTAGGDTALESAIQVEVAVGAASETRSLTAWQAGALQIGPALAAAGGQTMTVTISLPTTADNTLQGLDAGFTAQIDAIQARNTTAPTAGWVAD